MPNWVKNVLIVDRDENTCEKDVDKFLELFSDDFSFEKIAPIPDALKAGISPARICEDDEYIEGGKRITKAMSDKYIELYGANNWYDWCKIGWGCKWDACDVEIDLSPNDGFYMVGFETPWSPPRSFYEKLEINFPTLKFMSVYADECDNFEEICNPMDNWEDITLDGQWYINPYN